jgi:endo-1,4-beta-mannosidase
MPGYLGDRFLLGLNYWSQGGGPSMWDGLDLPRVERELRTMRDLGCNVFRSFLFLPSFSPAPPALSSSALERFGIFLRACQAHGLRTMPSILVGHMSGQNFEPPGRGSKSLYADPQLLAWQESLCTAAARVAAATPDALAAWVLSNEMPLWAGASDPLSVLAWADRLASALRRETPGVPVGTGDGLMSTKGGHNGFDPALLAGVVDYLGPHTYHTDRDALRHALRTDFVLRLLEHHGKPVLLEEFGASLSQAGDA